MPSRRMMMAYIMSHQSRLPAEYQEVEYIGAGDMGVDGGNNIFPYINFGVAWNEVAKIECGILVPTTSQSTILFSATVRQQAPFIAISRMSGVNLISSSPALTVLNDMAKHDMIMEISSSSTNIMATTYWDATWSPIISYYYIKLYNSNNVLVRDFVPCYRKSDNEIGLYDLVNGILYTNAGNGTFTKGLGV